MNGKQLERYVYCAYLAYVGIGFAVGSVDIAVGIKPIVVGLFGVALIAAGWLGQRLIRRRHEDRARPVEGSSGFELGVFHDGPCPPEG